MYKPRAKDLLSIRDVSASDIQTIFRLTDEIKAGMHRDRLSGKFLFLFFEKPSTRTDAAFDMGMRKLLGGDTKVISKGSSQVSRGETYEDTARIFNGYEADFILARLGPHIDIIEMANASRVPVINGLTDLEHPTQALSDIYTMRAHIKSLKDARVAFMGDIATNTSHSLMLAATKAGMEVGLVGPKEIKPDQELLEAARQYGTVKIFNDPKVGISGADFVYTDVWVSMNAGEEEEKDKRMEIFSPYQVNKDILKAAGRDALVMHCLPAHRKEEITPEVIDGPRSIVWEQAANKMYVGAAILIYLNDKFEELTERQRI